MIVITLNKRVLSVFWKKIQTYIVLLEPIVGGQIFTIRRIFAYIRAILYGNPNRSSFSSDN